MSGHAQAQESGGLTVATPWSRAVTRRNIVLTAANGFFVEAAMTLSEATMVLPLFVRALGGSSFLVGLVPSLRWFGWMAPQLVAAGQMRRLERFVPMVRALEFIRSSFYLVLALLAFLFGRSNPQLVLGAFFALFFLTRLAAGSSAVIMSHRVVEKKAG